MIVSGAMAAAVMRYCDAEMSLRTDPTIADAFDMASAHPDVDRAAQMIYDRLIELRKHDHMQARTALDYFEKLLAVMS